MSESIFHVSVYGLQQQQKYILYADQKSRQMGIKNTHEFIVLLLPCCKMHDNVERIPLYFIKQKLYEFTHTQNYLVYPEKRIAENRHKVPHTHAHAHTKE